MSEKLPGFIKKPKEFLQGTLQSLKGPGLENLVEEFTSEMTTVAEGLWEDQRKLQEEVTDLSVRQTLWEDQEDKSHAALSDEVQRLEARLGEMGKRLHQLEGKQQKLGKRSRVLFQVTVIVAIAAGAWVVTTLIQALVR